MNTFSATVTPIGFSAAPSPRRCYASEVLSSPCASDLGQSQSSLSARRAYFEPASTKPVSGNRSLQDSGSGGGICRPTPHDIAGDRRYGLSLLLPLIENTAAGPIHPRVDPWCSVCDHIKLQTEENELLRMKTLDKWRYFASDILDTTCLGLPLKVFERTGRE